MNLDGKNEKRITVYSHGFIGKVAFGYNYANQNSHLTLKKKDIKQIKKTDYSCINVEGGEKDLSYYWKKYTGNLKDRKYPQACLNYPTGKNIIRYDKSGPYILPTDRSLRELSMMNSLPVRC